MMIAIVVVLAGVVAVAVGHGGELSHEDADHAPLDLGPMSATDVVLLRPPTVLWGYSTQVTDQALERIAGAIRERDVRIVALEHRIAELTGYDDYPSPARHARRNRQLSDAGFYTAAEPPLPGSDPAPRPGPVSEPTASGPASEPAASEPVSEPAASEPVSEPASEPASVPVTVAESGHEPDAGTGTPAPEPATVVEQPAAEEITSDQAVNQTDG
jgi:hypothetical protein